MPPTGKIGSAKTSRATWPDVGCCWHRYRKILTAQNPKTSANIVNTKYNQIKTHKDTKINAKPVSPLIDITHLNMPTLQLENSELSFDLVETDEECSIALQPIDKTELGLFPNFWSSDKPTHNGARLKCGHLFSIAGLFQYWLKQQSVLCPLCRQGSLQAIDESSLPRHFQLAISNHIILIFESRDKLYKHFEYFSYSKILEITNLQEIQDFLDNILYYRVWVTVNNTDYPPSPWVPRNKSWMHRGRVNLTMHFMHQILACFYVGIIEF